MTSSRHVYTVFLVRKKEGRSEETRPSRDPRCRSADFFWRRKRGRTPSLAGQISPLELRPGQGPGQG